MKLPLFETKIFKEYKEKCIQLAENIEEWHTKFIQNNTFEND